MARRTEIPQLQALIRDMRAREALAVRAGTSPDYLYQVATGRRRASPNLASTIERETSGKVSKELLIFGPSSPKKRRREAA